MPSKNTVMVYTSNARKVYFLFDEVTPGNFYKAIVWSNSNYLKNGTPQNYEALGSCCREAAPEEIEEYYKIARESKYGKHLLQPELI